ncbi:MAG: ChaN family lipoprotein [Thiotrichales bacterium]|nr:ChaN family lipoprotein [Thiotrichales bacterium]
MLDARLLVLIFIGFCSGGVMAQTVNTGFQPEEIEVVSQTKTLKLNGLATVLKDAQVVVVGEYHDAWPSHLLQAELLKQLNGAQPQQWALGIEWLPVSSQAAIDDYLANQTDELEFLQASDYVNRWGFDARLVLPILSFAKQQGLNVVALNAPRELTRQVSQAGLESLTPEQRALFPNPLLPLSQQYQRFLTSFFSQNHIPPEKMDRMRTVQAIWDQTMALSAWRFLQAHPQHKMLILTGMVHATKGQGIADALQQLAPSLQVVNVGNGDFEDFVDKHFDYYALLPDIKLPEALTLGVRLQDLDGQLQIAEVNPDGLGAKLGLLPDDRLVSLAGKPIKTLGDLKILLWLCSDGSKPILKWLRHDALLDIDIPYASNL